MKIAKSRKRMLLVLIDIGLIHFSFLTAFYFIFMADIPKMLEYSDIYIRSSVWITLIYIITFYFFKLYESLWTHASIDEFISSVGGCIVATSLFLAESALSKGRLPFRVTVLAGVFSVIYVVGFRMSFRIYRRIVINFSNFNNKDYKKVMIIGAGSAGVMIINEMKKHPEMKYLPVALIDDSRYKQWTMISGVKVMGNRNSIKEVAKNKDVDEIIIAIPSLSGEDRREIIELCNETGCKTKLIPGMYELIGGQVTLQQIRPVEVEDLLGRDSVILDNEGISEYLSGKTVLVTGGGGSIGSELCRQIAKYNPKELMILDVYENNAYDLQNELKYNFPHLKLIVLIASVRDKVRLEKIFKEYRPQVVFHAAAHKHVPLMEDSPTEAIKNNVFGTLNVSECADKYAVERFVLISTDKAVNPTNIMGASKRLCEMVIQAMDKHSKTEFVAVRFGNVLGSNGSVIPLFKKQIAQGGPVTVTHKYITRYFMTIPEAAQLVLQAGAYAEGGEIFVLDMGKPVKIYDLACDLIRLSGFEPHKDIEIKITGLRPGEKLYEELLMAEEGLGSTKHEKIFVGRPTFSDLDVLKHKFVELKFAIENGSREEFIAKVEELVPTYKRVDNNVAEAGDEEIASTEEVMRVVTAG